MNEQLFIGVDLGTSFIKTAVYSLDGVRIADASAPVRDERPGPGIFIQRGEFIYESVCDCLKKTAEALGPRAKDVAGMAFTGQMAGSMGVDADFEDVTTFSCTLDSRYLPFAESQRERFAEDMFFIGGTSAPVMCSKYEWFRTDFPEEHKRIAKYVLLNGYVIGKLARLKAKDAKIDYSLITWTGLSDIKNRSWSEKICRGLDIEPDILPEIVNCTTVGGYLDADIAKELGLPAGVPLIVGAGDKVAGCTGAAIFDDGEMIFEAASYGAISCHVKEPRMNAAHRNYDVIGAVDEKSFYLHKYIQGSGISTDWFVNEFMNSFKEAEELAAPIGVGSEKLFAIGLLSGSAIPFDAETKGLFMGHTWAHNKGHFYHALLESFSYDLALTLRAMEEMYPEYKENHIKLIGGGAKSAIWPQMLADVTGRTFERLDREDVAMWGAALLAAKGVGAIDDLYAAAKAHVGIKAVFTPDPEKHEAYKPYVNFYEKQLDRLHDTYKELREI